MFALQTLVILVRFHKWIAAAGIRYFVNRDYQHPLIFDSSYLLCNIPTTIWCPQNVVPEADVPLAPSSYATALHPCEI